MERRELEPLLEAVRDLDFHRILHRRQDFAEEWFEVFFIEMQVVGCAKCLKDRHQMLALLQRSLINRGRARRIKEVAIRCQRIKATNGLRCQTKSCAFFAFIFQLDIDRWRLMHNMRIVWCLVFDMDFNGFVPHDGEKFPQQCRRQLEPLLVEQKIAITII